MTRVRAAVDRVGPRNVEGDLGAAVALAVDRLRQLGGARRIVVLTDGNLARPALLSGASLPMRFRIGDSDGAFTRHPPARGSVRPCPPPPASSSLPGRRSRS